MKPARRPVKLSIFIEAVLLSRKLQSIRRKQGCNFKISSLNFWPLCQILSKAFETSLSTTSVFEW